ncbi:hypothetical protein YC2023_021399 [Brassica napus]
MAEVYFSGQGRNGSPPFFLRRPVNKRLVRPLSLPSSLTVVWLWSYDALVGRSTVEKVAACTVVVFFGRWRLLQIHRRRFELPGRESSSDSSSPAFSYGERRLPKIRASIWDPDVLWEKGLRG